MKYSSFKIPIIQSASTCNDSLSNADNFQPARLFDGVTLFINLHFHALIRLTIPLAVHAVIDEDDVEDVGEHEEDLECGLTLGTDSF